MAAPEVPIKGGNAQVKLRNPVNSALLSLVPFYGIFWYYYVNREMADLGKARGTGECGDNPTNSLLALIPGAFIIVPPFISMWNACKRLQAAQRIAGIPEAQIANNAIVFILFLVFSPLGIWMFQAELNKVWASETEGGAALLASGPAAGAPVASTGPVSEPVATGQGEPPAAP
jgi:hypothetical protein